MGDENWIKIHRDILKNPVFQNEKMFKVWMWCLLKASYLEHEHVINRQKIVLKPGEFVFGRKKAAVELSMKEPTVYDYIRLLKDHNRIDIKSNNKYSIVSIENWTLYQRRSNSTNNKTINESDNKPTTNQQQINNKSTTNQHIQERKEGIKGKEGEKGKENLFTRTSERPPENAKVLAYDKQAEIIAKDLYDKIKENNKYVKQPKIEKWAEEVDKIHRLDKIPWEDISDMARWCQEDEFWKTVILSAANLRKQFPKMWSKMQKDGAWMQKKATEEFLADDSDDIFKGGIL